jgi:uncharacterized protein YigA (DUF484 family)
MEENIKNTAMLAEVSVEELRQRIDYLEAENRDLQEKAAMNFKWWQDASDRLAKMQTKMQTVKNLINVLFDDEQK